jgi:hypothetical protein
MLNSWLWNAIGGLTIKAVNSLIEGLGSVLGVLFAVLPDLPPLPEPPAALVLAESWVAWAFPVTTLLNILAFVLSSWLVWQAVAIALRWAKAINS